MEKIKIGSFSLSREGWEWWIEQFKKNKYSFHKWIKVNKAIVKITKALNND